VAASHASGPCQNRLGSALMAGCDHPVEPRGQPDLGTRIGTGPRRTSRRARTNRQKKSAEAGPCVISRRGRDAHTRISRPPRSTAPARFRKNPARQTAGDQPTNQSSALTSRYFSTAFIFPSASSASICSKIRRGVTARGRPSKAGGAYGSPKPPYDGQRSPYKRPLTRAGRRQRASRGRSFGEKCNSKRIRASSTSR
jgi:hypothetical protein